MSVTIFYLNKRFIFSVMALLLTGLCLHCGGGGGSDTLNDSSGIIPIASEGCGDAELDPGEGCDDGNWENSDGCNARCGLEVGESICGNGIKENDECCDDGNLTNGDGCSSACTLESSTQPPSAPVLAADPADGVTWSPTRLYLSWSASTDPDVGDTVVYDVYFVEGNGIPSDAVPYKGGIKDTKFIIQASTDNRSQYFPDQVTPIYPKPNQTYSWKVCAKDNHGAAACSSKRTFNTDDSVVGWWRFDENPASTVCSGVAAGEMVCDYSGNNNHGVPNGGVTWLSPPDPLILGGALSFDGTSGYVSVSNDQSLNITNQVSIATIVKPSASSAIRRIASKLNDVSPFNGYDLDINNATNKFRMAICNSSCPQVESGTGVVNGSLYTVVGTYDQINMKIYVNGALDGTSALAGNIGSNTFPLYIGKQFTSDFYKGSIQDVILFNRGLDVKEVQNYNSSSTP
jgi:cysteine-rich repeat protein